MRVMFIFGLLALLVDQATKYHALYVLNLETVRVVEIWSPYIVYQMAWNTGINFGILGSDGQGTRWILIALALAICAWIIRWVWVENLGVTARVFAGLLLGGALGNVIDRIYYGAVVDFLNMSCCGIDNPFSFNVADVSVFVGVAGMLLFGTPNKTT